jgi:hypothetical protein
MNKLLFPNGGVTLEGDDFRFQDAAYRDAFAAMYHLFLEGNQGNCILFGCEFVISNSAALVFNAGYVILDNELRYFPGASIVSALYGISDLFFVKDDGFDISGLEDLVSGGQGNTYEQRSAKLEFLPSTNIKIQAYDSGNSFRIDNLIIKQLLRNESQYLISVFYNNWTSSVNAPVFAIKRYDKQVFLTGIISDGISTINTYTLIFKLPSTYYPTKRQYRIVPCPNSGFVILDINTDGEVYLIDPQNVAANGVVDLSQISFLTS